MSLADYLRQMAPTGRPSVEDYVLRHGQVFHSQPLTTAELQLVRATVAGGHWPIKQCYANSQAVILHDLDLNFEYVEGYVWDDACPLAILHGWLSLHGKVIDLTLRTKTRTRRRTWLRDRILGEFAGREYYGVRFTQAQVTQHLIETDTFGALIDDWEHGYPLLGLAAAVG